MSAGEASQATYFDLTTLKILHSFPLPNYAVTATATNLHGDRLALADGRSDRIVLMQMPHLQETHNVLLGGEPVDIDVDVDAGHVYAITHNGNFWIDSVALDLFDTLEVRLFPRRLTLKPPARLEAWVVCVGNEALHIIDLPRRVIVRTDSFDSPPTDVAFSPDGSKAYIAFAGASGRVTSYNSATLEPLSNYPAGSGPFSLAVSSDGQLLAASDSLTGMVQIWDLASNQSWSVRAGNWAGSLYFMHETHTLYVLAEGLNQVKRVRIGANGPEAVDSLRFDGETRNMILWENRD